jgi:hypothetical protein
VLLSISESRFSLSTELVFELNLLFSSFFRCWDYYWCWIGCSGRHKIIYPASRSKCSTFSTGISQLIYHFHYFFATSQYIRYTSNQIFGFGSIGLIKLLFLFCFLWVVLGIACSLREYRIWRVCRRLDQCCVCDFRWASCLEQGAANLDDASITML